MVIVFFDSFPSNMAKRSIWYSTGLVRRPRKSKRFRWQLVVLMYNFQTLRGLTRFEPLLELLDFRFYWFHEKFIAGSHGTYALTSGEITCIQCSSTASKCLSNLKKCKNLFIHFQDVIQHLTLYILRSN